MIMFKLILNNFNFTSFAKLYIYISKKEYKDKKESIQLNW